MTKKILIISQSGVIGTVGGAIKVFCQLANVLSNLDYEVITACYNQKKGKPFIKLDEKVRFINLYHLDTKGYLKKQHKIPLFEKIISDIFTRQAAKFCAFDYSRKVEYLIEEEKPDLIIYFFPLMLFQSTFMKNFDIPQVLCYHSRPDVYYNKHLSAEKKIIPLFKIATKKVNYVQVLFESYKKLAKKYLNSNCKIETIYNYIEIPESQVQLEQEKKKLIYLSRIDKFKGADFLIKSFSKIATKYPDWEVHIYGEIQPLSFEDDLNNLIKMHNLQNQVKLNGVTNNPVEKFLQSDICVFPSYLEGFPMGLIEAMATGLPCIGLKSCSGVNELIKNNENGFLCKKNENDFAAKMALLIENKDLRIEFGKNARKSMEKYSYLDNYANLWDNFIKQILKETNQINGFVKK
ncbi:MAG: glycosyltransferase [Candidatus Gastranaerophilaceae bacterium]|jgi:glycosyltransferase involved in cell wall biosynthesis